MIKTMVSLKRINNLFDAVIILMMALGSFVFVYNEIFAFGTFVVLFFGPIYFLRFINDPGKHLKIRDNVLFLSLLFLILFSIVSILLNPSIENFRYFKAFLFSFFAFLIIHQKSKNNSHAIELGLVLFCIVIIFIAFLQISYLYIGIGIDPTRLDADDYIASDTFGKSGVRSIFSDTNVFSAVCSMLLIFLIYQMKSFSRCREILIFILSAMIFLAASRVAIVSLALIWASRYIKHPEMILKGVFFFLSLLIAWYFLGAYFYDMNNGAFWFEKVQKIDHLIQYHAGDGSVDLRISTYNEFFSKFLHIGLGSFNAFDYGYILSDELMRKNPHSLMVELSLLFGYFGFLIFWIFIFWNFLNLKKEHGFLVSMLLSLSILFLTFTGSSMINFPAYWVVFFAIGSSKCLEASSDK
jgi:hypothetical protein